MKIKKLNLENITITKEEAFYLLLNNLDFSYFDRLCTELAREFNMSIYDMYQLVKDMNAPLILKQKVFNQALEMVMNNRPIGYKLDENNFITHSLKVGFLMSSLAEFVNFDKDKAFTIGLLHDYGKKCEYVNIRENKKEFNNINMIGFNELIKLGYTNEAFACVDHLYEVNDMNFNYAISIDDFKQYFNIDLMSKIKYYKYYINYNCSIYDLILNIAHIICPNNEIGNLYQNTKQIELNLKDTKKIIYEKNIINLLSKFFEYALINYNKKEVLDTLCTQDYTNVSLTFKNLLKFFEERFTDSFNNSLVELKNKKMKK